MILLLDMHVFLWFASRPEDLAKEAFLAIEDPVNDVFISAIVAWEIGISHAANNARSRAGDREAFRLVRLSVVSPRDVRRYSGSPGPGTLIRSPSRRGRPSCGERPERLHFAPAVSERRGTGAPMLETPIGSKECFHREYARTLREARHFPDSRAPAAGIRSTRPLLPGARRRRKEAVNSNGRPSARP